MAVLLADFLAAVGAITFVLLYAKVNLGYLLRLLGITFGLSFVVWGLLAQADVARGPKLGQRPSIGNELPPLGYLVDEVKTRDLDS